MSRFNDGECDCEEYAGSCLWSCRRALLWEANLRRALAGTRGQRFLAEFEQALMALPQHRLIAGAICAEGEVCAIGAYAAWKKVQAHQATLISEAIYQLGEEFDGWRDENGHVFPGKFGDASDYGKDWETAWETAYLGKSFGMAKVLAYEVAQKNDDEWYGTPEQRWARALEWAGSNRK